MGKVSFTDEMSRLIDNIVESAKEIALHAGEIQLEYFRSDTLTMESKFRDADIVTAADKACEAYILNEISRQWPGHSVMAEESGEHDGSSPWRWVIDPLDGTTNFSNGLPLFCVSIGIMYGDKTVAGVVYAPKLGEIFVAKAGCGATMNGKPIHCSSKTALSKSVIATGFPYDKEINTDNNLDNVSRVMPRVRGLRRLGSAAIDLCYTAAGFLDGYWEIDLHEWDVCAGMLIASEAGAVCRRFRPDRGWCILAAAPGITDELSALVG